MNTLSIMSVYIHNIKAHRFLGKCRSFSGVSNSHLFSHSSRNPAFQPHFILWKRFCSSQNQETRYPDLTDFPVYVWPNFFTSLKNRLLSSFVIRPYFDEHFDLDEFVEVSKEVVVRVSAYLAQGNLDELDELVTPEVLGHIKENIKKFSLKHRMALGVEKKDIFSCYTHSVGVIMPDREGQLIQELPGERFVEITMIYHVLKGYQDSDSNQSGGPYTYPDFSRNFTVLNYRFIRNYSPGIKDSYWIINGLNHSKPLQHMAL